MTNTTFFLPVRIYYEDTDAGGIVYYANYFKYAERARTELLRTLGNGRRSQLENGLAFVVTQAASRFISPARLDDLIHVTCAIVEVTASCIVFKQHAILPEGNIICAELDVTVCTVDLSAMRPCRIPKEIRTALEAVGAGL